MGLQVEKLLRETRQVIQALAEVSDELRQSRGLSANEQVLLNILARKPSPATVAMLARATLATARDTHLAVAALRDRGWVTCQPEALDARGARVGLSPLGHAGWVELHADERVLVERLAASLDEQAVNSTFATLRAVRRLLQRAPALVPTGVPGSRIRGRAPMNSPP